MSRIGRLPVAVPSGVEVTLDGQVVQVRGPKGTLQHRVKEPITVPFPVQEDPPPDGHATPWRRLNFTFNLAEQT